MHSPIISRLGHVHHDTKYTSVYLHWSVSWQQEAVVFVECFADGHHWACSIPHHIAQPFTHTHYAAECGVESAYAFATRQLSSRPPPAFTQLVKLLRS